MKLTIISQNIRCANDPDGHGWEDRKPRIKALMDQYHADVVGFQEIRPVWLEFLETAFGETYEIYCQYRTTTGKPEGPAIMWKREKFELLKKGTFWLSDTPEKESDGWDTLGYPRNAVWVTLRERESGKTFTYINTHFGFGDEGQVKSAKVIYDHIGRCNMPALVTADFNMKPDAPAYAAMTEKLTDLNMATARDPEITYHAYGAKDGCLIDYIFLTEEFKPLTYRRMTETFDGKFPSDHYGIYGEVEL